SGWSLGAWSFPGHLLIPSECLPDDHDGHFKLSPIMLPVTTKWRALGTPAGRDACSAGTHSSRRQRIWPLYVLAPVVAAHLLLDLQPKRAPGRHLVAGILYKSGTPRRPRSCTNREILKQGGSYESSQGISGGGGDVIGRGRVRQPI